MGHQRKQVVVPAERVLGAAEPSEVVGHVTGVVGHPGHPEDVSVVGGVGACHMPQQERPDHDDVGGAEGAPACRDQAVHAPAVEAVEAPQRNQRDDRRHDRADHGGQLQNRWLGGEPGVDGRRRRQSRRGGADEVGEDADDLRAQVGIGEAGALLLAGGRIGEPDERRERARVGRGDLDSRTSRGGSRAYDARTRNACDDDVAVGDVDALRGDPDEERGKGGLLAALGRRAEHRTAVRRHRADHVARHRHRHICRHLRNQRRRNVVQLSALRPVQRRGRLHHRQQRGGHRQQEADQASDRRDPASHFTLSSLMAAP